MASSQLLRSTDLSGDVPIIAAGRPVVAEFERLRDFLDERGMGLSVLFAEPVFGGRTPTGYRNASWYTNLEGQPVAYHDLPEAARPAVAQRLRAQIEALTPWFDDPTYGALLQRAILTPTPDCVMVIGNHCVLIKWGMAPASHPQGEDGLRRLFSAGVGAVAGLTQLPRMPQPDVASGDAASGAGGGGGADATAGEPVGPDAPPASAEPPPPPSASWLASQQTPDGTAHAAPGAAGGASPVGAAAGDHGDPQYAGAVGAGGAMAASATVIDSTPWYRQPGVIAGLIVLGFLIGIIVTLLLLGYRPFTVSLIPHLAEGDRRALEAGTLDALQAERDRLRGLLGGEVCMADPGQLPGGPLTLPVRPPAVGDAAPGTATPPVADPLAPEKGEAPKQLTLNDYLERSTVMVLTGEGMGSGFFVGPKTIVTNLHVVQQSNGGVAPTVVVTSKALGRVLAGRVTTTSNTAEIGGRDYAVIELEEAPPSAPVSLPLARSIEKRATVVAAGYPGYLVLNDPDMQRLNRGDISAAPEMVLSDGKVQVVQIRDNSPPIIIHSADISQGNSGGPLVDDCGRLVGINTFIGLDEKSGRRGLFSLGSADLIEFLAERQVPIAIDDAACGPR